MKIPIKVKKQVQDSNVELYPDGKAGVKITSGKTIWKRLWCVISNPFRYLITGAVYY
jgi:hypothetical protein